jgi:hypothetical protein
VGNNCKFPSFLKNGEYPYQIFGDWNYIQNEAARSHLLCPTLPQQIEFAQRVEKVRELEASQSVSRTSLDALFQTMLYRAFNAEL